MFGSLTEKFQQLFSSLAGKKVLTEENVSDAVRQVRLALLDADVNYSVVSQFVKRVKEKALGEGVTKSVSPDQQFIKIVHDELAQLMSSSEEESRLHLDREVGPSVCMLCGLQGSGKTTQAAKLALYLRKQSKRKKIWLVACDLQRPAAVEQLKVLGSQIEIPVFSLEGEKDPCKVARQALEAAKKELVDVVIVDTAGRLHIDEELMKQLQDLKALMAPQEILFVASAGIGQDAVKTALEFDRHLSITGTMLTMLDGTARAGAAISIREITKKPLKFEGIGEKVDDLQPFQARSMADRILGMGDVINLVRRAQEQVSEEEAAAIEKKLLKASFTYADFLKQMKMMQKMGSMKSLLKMIPGMPSLDQMDFDEKKVKRLEAIILSMTPKEREEKVELTPRRRDRIAAGSGSSIEDVHRMIKNFKQMKQMLKELPALKKQFLRAADTKEKCSWH